MKRIPQKLLSWLLSLCLTMAAIPMVGLSSMAEDILTEGDFEYTVCDNEVKITRYLGNDTEIIFPSQLGGLPVTQIGVSVINVEARMKVTSITIPEGVTSTLQSFQGCFFLTNVTLPNSLIEIGNGTFYSCDSLARIVIPDGVRVIGRSAFMACYSLADITIPSSVTIIDDAAFAGCRSLREIVIPHTVERFGREVFSESAWPTEMPIPNLTIFSAPQTAAQHYAQSYGISFVPIIEYSTDTLGDINGDGSIDALDALLALQHSVRLIALRNSSFAAADMDQNNSVDAQDALLILQHSVRLISY